MKPLACNCAFLVALMVAAPASAQTLPDSILDQRVRVQLQRESRGVGILQVRELAGPVTAVTRDTVWIRIHHSVAPIAVGADGIRRLELTRGTSRLRSAVGGGIGAALVWGLFGGLADRDELGFWNAAGRSAVGGLAFGSAFGLIFPREGWKRVNFR